ncbi:hypothetical protein M427DRAFT_59381 [Gonapodya prolifera JEL478]|uniref:D-isomer specific 2-hydroxyacid dehydrogenase NAD-binding domain-containing protein n=1 Tax=Gonapodya prolifera (strain JEL478) TaxID=1344416 RepID=A0A139A873_GONPJ|nr:hypothetical protein M427DRAFT_59381 [Gonapodya prolifera JEL478]|eukprot:KXS12645.1 hypothetical protein M427DRAFT_59381 [Gonapodya prolifera JEL478]
MIATDSDHTKPSRLPLLIIVPEIYRAIVPSLVGNLAVKPIYLHADLTAVDPADEELIDEAEAVFRWGYTWSGKQVGALARRCRKLRWLHSPSAGIEGFLVPDLLSLPNLVVTNATGVHSIPIAEFVLGVILAHVKRHVEYRALDNLPDHADLFRIGKSLRCGDVFGRNVLIFGLGSIGLEIGKRCKAFGMNVWGSRRSAQDPIPGVADLIVGPDRWRSLLPEVDFLVLTSPLNNETKGLIDSTVLGKLKKGAYLINVARGAIVNENDLVDVLNSDQLSGAAIDVFDPEPPSPTSPIFTDVQDRRKLFLTPHISWTSGESNRRTLELWARNLAAFVEGSPMVNVCDHRAMALSC